MSTDRTKKDRRRVTTIHRPIEVRRRRGGGGEKNRREFEKDRSVEKGQKVIETFRGRTKY